MSGESNTVKPDSALPGAVSHKSAPQGAKEESEAQAPLPTPPDMVLRHLKELGISYDFYEHPPVFTADEALEGLDHMDAVHCRNLFLRDKKKNNYLVVAANETLIDLKKLAPLIGAGRLSFGSPQRLWQYLGIRPGSVNPFCMMNDAGHDVTLVLDQYMMACDRVAYHPMDNAMTITISPADLMRFLQSLGREAQIVDLSHAAPEPE